MKNILIGLFLGLVLSGIICYAKENIIMNPVTSLYNRDYWLSTTKVTATDGTYRVFMYKDGYGAALSVIKVK